MSNHAHHYTKEIVVIGAGISGLAAAFHLQQTLNSNTRVRLLEATDRLGGVLETKIENDLVLEQSADMFSVEPPAALELCRHLGIESELLEATPTPDRAFIASANGNEPVPRGFSLMLPGNVASVLASNLLSESGKKRFLEEEQITPKTDDVDESLESFAVRRFGQEVFEKLIQPLASGIYTADPKLLSMQATMSRFIDLEKKFGSLIFAGKSVAGNEATSGARYNLFRAPKLGIGRLVDALGQSLKEHQDCPVEILLGSKVNHVQTASGDENRFEIQLEGNDESIVCDGLIVATPSFATARLLQSLQTDWTTELTSQLSSIEFASSAVVIMAVDRRSISQPDFPAYGIVIPSHLGRNAIAISIASNKFSFRSDPQTQILRVFIGGALQGELVELSDANLIEIARDECETSLGLKQPPKVSSVVRWRNCMPQYHVGHLDRIAQIEGMVQRIPGLELAGKSYRGVGIPACIESGINAANRLLASDATEG